MYFVYILFSKSNNLYYKGFTADPLHRLYEHNSGLSRYTSSNGPWELVYLKEYCTKREALIEERRLKKLKGRSLEVLIHSAGNQINKFGKGGTVG